VTPATRRAPRKDAQRNRERIVEAAREIVAERDVAAKMEDVAARAGVGIGTLYRFVPTKDALLGGILREEAERLAELADRALALPAGASAFHTWMTEAAAKRFLALQLDALAPGHQPPPGRALTERQLELTLDALAHSRRLAPGANARGGGGLP
jgi:AcrR family transcriptional regulator